MKTIIHKAETRGHANHGWLNTHHTFSFANYYNPERVHFGALRVLNDDWIAGGEGFGKHPHDNMEIITIPLKGAVEHQDSMGNKGVINAGEHYVDIAEHLQSMGVNGRLVSLANMVDKVAMKEQLSTALRELGAL